MQSIIVYRNPLEAAMYDALLNTNAIPVIFLSILITIPVVMLLDKVWTRYRIKSVDFSIVALVVCVFSLVVSVGVLN